MTLSLDIMTHDNSRRRRCSDSTKTHTYKNIQREKESWYPEKESWYHDSTKTHIYKDIQRENIMTLSLDIMTLSLSECLYMCVFVESL